MAPPYEKHLQVTKVSFILQLYSQILLGKRSQKLPIKTEAKLPLRPAPNVGPTKTKQNPQLSNTGPFTSLLLNFIQYNNMLFHTRCSQSHFGGPRGGGQHPTRSPEPGAAEEVPLHGKRTLRQALRSSRCPSQVQAPSGSGAQNATAQFQST